MMDRPSFEKSVPELLGDSRAEISRLVREEIQLAQREIKEKLATYGKGAVGLATGVTLGFAGLLVFLAGLGWLLAFAFQHLGMNPTFSVFLGMSVMGVLTAGLGAALVFGGMAAMTRESPAPQRTLRTLQSITGAGGEEHESPGASSRKSPKELERDVLAAHETAQDQLAELAARASPHHLKNLAEQNIREHPYRSLFIVIGTALAGTLWWNRMHRRRGPLALRNNLK